VGRFPQETGTEGIIPPAGDIGGTIDTPVVRSIGGVDVTLAGGATGDVLTEQSDGSFAPQVGTSGQTVRYTHGDATLAPGQYVIADAHDQPSAPITLEASIAHSTSATDGNPPAVTIDTVTDGAQIVVVVASQNGNQMNNNWLSLSDTAGVFSGFPDGPYATSPGGAGLSAGFGVPSTPGSDTITATDTTDESTGSAVIAFSLDGTNGQPGKVLTGNTGITGTTADLGQFFAVSDRTQALVVYALCDDGTPTISDNNDLTWELIGEAVPIGSTDVTMVNYVTFIPPGVAYDDVTVTLSKACGFWAGFFVGAVAVATLTMPPASGEGQLSVQLSTDGYGGEGGGGDAITVVVAGEDQFAPALPVAPLPWSGIGGSPSPTTVHFISDGVDTWQGDYDSSGQG